MHHATKQKKQKILKFITQLDKRISHLVIYEMQKYHANTAMLNYYEIYYDDHSIDKFCKIF